MLRDSALMFRAEVAPSVALSQTNEPEASFFFLIFLKNRVRLVWKGGTHSTDVVFMSLNGAETVCCSGMSQLNSFCVIFVMFFNTFDKMPNNSYSYWPRKKSPRSHFIVGQRRPTHETNFSGRSSMIFTRILSPLHCLARVDGITDRLWTGKPLDCSGIVEALSNWFESSKWCVFICSSRQPVQVDTCDWVATVTLGDGWWRRCQVDTCSSGEKLWKVVTNGDVRRHWRQRWQVEWW